MPVEYATAGPLQWWQLDSGPASDFFIYSQDIIGIISRKPALKTYFTAPTDENPEGRLQRVIADVDENNQTVQRYTPSHTTKMKLFEVLMWQDAARMKEIPRLRKKNTESQVKRPVPLNPAYKDALELSATKRGKAAAKIVSLLKCALYIFNADLENDDPACADEDSTLTIDINRLVSRDPQRRAKQGIEANAVSWEEFKQKLSTTDYRLRVDGNADGGTVGYANLSNERVLVNSKAKPEAAIKFLHDNASAHQNQEWRHALVLKYE